MKRELNTCLEITDSDGSTVMYADIEEAVKMTGLTKRQLELRATKGTGPDGSTYKWCSETTYRSYLGKRSRRKGSSWELEVIDALKKAGYEGCMSARSESKRTDDAKIDIIDVNGELPCHIQAKNTKVMPNYHKIRAACPIKDKPFVIACKKGSERPPIAVLPIDFFYELIRKK